MEGGNERLRKVFRSLSLSRSPSLLHTRLRTSNPPSLPPSTSGKLSSSSSAMDPTDYQEEAQPSLPWIDPPFDASIPSLPISYPIKTLEELESGSYFNSFHFPFNIASVPLPSASSSSPDRPRLLVCHDMAGGYLDDKWVQGSSTEEAYAIWHWYLIDVFVYFSHNLVTIPPPSWTNTAHLHGVKVLGTFIIEWEEAKDICDKLLSTKADAQKYAECLSNLAVALGFDGWLLNIEVGLDAKQIPNLKEFISHLTQTMHSSVPGSLVIWYDAVTKDGRLSYQNQLNENNKPFFDVCDGIFVNYRWKEDYPMLSATVAGERKFDVYMGIDVFGRGTYGGGGWKTNDALDVLKKSDVSAAIFAPGWVYENKEPPDFQTAQNRWWGLVEESWGIAQRYPKVLPFYSNFDQGRGYHFSVDGRKVSDDDWSNISSQTFQPVLHDSVDLSGNVIKVLVDFEEASYNGGANITFKGVLRKSPYFVTSLFQGELPLGDLPIHVTYSVRSDGNSLLGVSLSLSSNTNESVSVLLASCGETLLTMNQFASKFDKVIMPFRVTKLETEAQTTPGWVIQESSIQMNGYTLKEVHVVCYGKTVFSELRSAHDLEPEGTNFIRKPTKYYASLGHLTMKTSEQNMNFPSSASWVVEGQYIYWASVFEGTKTLRFKIVWRLKEGDASLFPKYNIYVGKLSKQAVDSEVKGDKEYLGVARVQAFYVADYVVVVPSDVSSLKFIIQVCSNAGDCQDLDSSPSFQLNVEGN